MEVQMKDSLARRGPGVDDDAVALGDALLDCKPGYDAMNVTQQSLVSGRQILMLGDWLARHHEKVNGRLGIAIPERNTVLVLEYDVGGDFLVDDLDK